ncbi:Phototropin-1B like protein [Verticillium longisporum]|nr:Phototropin-1B like protein [Verticillium longisporum]
MRLRSNSSLSLHINEDALRRYTDYNSDGSPRSPTFGRVVWGSIDGVAIKNEPSKPAAGTPTLLTTAGTSEQPLPIPDFWSNDTFQSALANPRICRRLLRFAQSRGCETDVEFLMRLQSYASSLEQFIAEVATVPSPTNLPFPVAKSLNSDMKHLNTAVLPGLESIFAESKFCVERRVWKDLYPSFVRHQLVSCAGSAFTCEEGPRPNGYPGLGDAFCLMSAQAADSSIISASDGFLAVTGYGRQEAVGRRYDLLHGSHTDKTALRRMREAVSRGQAFCELMLNYRRDSWPFWNLLYLLPLTTTDGTVRHYLGGHINVSETIGSQDDIVRVLSHDPADLDQVKDSRLMQDPSLGRRLSTQDCKADRRSSVRQRSGSNATKGFFKQFKKAPTSHRISIRATSFCSMRGLPEPRRPDALAFLGIDQTVQAVTRQDIFTVLAEHAQSPSVTKSFRNTVRERVLRDGRQAVLDIAKHRSNHRRKQSLVGGLTGRPKDETREAAREKKHSRPGSRSGFASFVGVETPKADGVMSCWTPLKDGAGVVDWIVVMLTPS